MSVETSRDQSDDMHAGHVGPWSTTPQLEYLYHFDTELSSVVIAGLPVGTTLVLQIPGGEPFRLETVDYAGCSVRGVGSGVAFAPETLLPL